VSGRVLSEFGIGWCVGVGMRVLKAWVSRQWGCGCACRLVEGFDGRGTEGKNEKGGFEC
jgi:hypothetical protein